MQTAVGNFVDAGLPTTRGMTYSEREADEQRVLIVVQAELEDHAPCPVRCG